MGPTLFKLFAALAFTYVVLETTNAAMHTAPARVKDGKCYYANTKSFLAPDESLSLPGCKQVTCIKNRNQYRMRTVTCGIVDKQCRIPGDKSLPYPLCCPTNGCNELY